MAKLGNVTDHNNEAGTVLGNERFHTLHGEIEMLRIERPETLVEKEGVQAAPAAGNRLSQDRGQEREKRGRSRPRRGCRPCEPSPRP